MAPPPNLKRLAAENFEEAEDWFKEAFLPQLNGFLGDVVDALSGALTYSENLRVETREIDFTTNSNVTTGDASPFPLIIRPQKVLEWRNAQIINVENLTDSSAVGLPSGAVQALYRRGSNGECVVRLITGLNVDTKYRFRVRFD